MSSQSIMDKVRQFTGKDVTVKICLDNEDPCLEHDLVIERSTFDSIRGKILVSVVQDTRVDSIAIVFSGTMQNSFERLTSTLSAAHNERYSRSARVIELVQPGLREQLPQDMILRASKSPYEFPFHFVVPALRPESNCSHQVANPTVHEHHLALPPSLGVPMVAGSGSKLLDDMAPRMSTVSYQLVAKVKTPTTRLLLPDCSRRVRIVPTTEELPPVDIDARNDDFCMRKEKSVRTKGMFGKKTGRVVAMAVQPSSFCRPSIDQQSAAAGTASTMATVILRFDPADESQQPPKIGGVSCKLQAMTFYSAVSEAGFPITKDAMVGSPHGFWSDTVHLASRNMESVEWQPHDGSLAPERISLERRSSVHLGQVLICPSPSSSYRSGSSFYTAELYIPVSLPTTKVFLPTFHCCLVSRTYVLALSIGMSPRNVGRSLTTSLDLKVPVQIRVAPTAEAQQHRVSLQEELEYSVDEFFRPRNMSLGPVVTNGDSVEAPPDYSYFTPHRVGASIVPACG